MAIRSLDPYPRGTLARDKDGDVWRKGTAWWHWTGRSLETGPGKLQWYKLEEMYGPITILTD